MKDREINIAREFNILDKVQKLESELLNIEGVTEVDYDLFGFYDYMGQVIFLAKYSTPFKAEEYYPKRKQLIDSVIEVAKLNGLERTGDRIEDCGEHLYFVMKHDETWRTKE